jgi:hypothetical protein
LQSVIGVARRFGSVASGGSGIEQAFVLIVIRTGLLVLDCLAENLDQVAPRRRKGSADM